MCSDFYGNSGDLRTNFLGLNLTILYGILKNKLKKKEKKILAAEFLEFSLKIF